MGLDSDWNIRKLMNDNLSQRVVRYIPRLIASAEREAAEEWLKYPTYMA